MLQAKYIQTVVGWYNVTVDGYKINVDPATFTRITGVQSDVAVGCGELSTEQVNELKAAGRIVAIIDDGVEWVPVGAIA